MDSLSADRMVALHQTTEASGMTFEQFCRDNGLIVDHIPQDGKWHSYRTENKPRKKNGSAKLALDGLIGWCQDFATQTEVNTWRPDNPAKVAPLDYDAIKRRQAEAYRVRMQAINDARYYYKACKPLRGSHPYLEAHRLSMEGCTGLRVDRRDNLVIPAVLNYDIMSIQRIAADGTKLFWKDAPIQGAHFMIHRQNAVVTVLCEGFATGAAIFAAFPLCKVCVTFNTGNMKRIAETMLFTGLTVIAADNDTGTQKKIGINPGIVAANEAAAHIGCGVAVPVCDGNGTDWCDYRNERMDDLLRAGCMRSEQAAQRVVDACIAAEIQRNAVFVTTGVKHAKRV